MKTLFACTGALALTVAIAGWAEPAAADGPFELNRTQLDRITAGNGDDRALEVVTLNFDKSPPPQAEETWEFSLRVDGPGTGSEQSVVRTFTFHDSFPIH